MVVQFGLVYNIGLKFYHQKLNMIHNRPGVSARTRAKIQEILEKHNFERNVLASTLAFTGSAVH
jgi:DNA-binding LacI/PurR family transcriptional regulator